MKLAQVDPDTIKKMIAEKAAAKQQLTAANATLRSEIAAFVKPREQQMAENDKSFKEIERLEDFLCCAFVARAAATTAIRHLRKRLPELRSKASSKNITVGNLERLRVKISECERDLQAACHHPFVLRINGYKSWSHSDDDDRSHEGEGQCAMCGLHARDTDYVNTNVVMPQDGTRLWRRASDEVPYDPKRRSADDRTVLRERVAAYAALPDAESVADHFFGTGMKKLQELMELAPTKTEKA